MSFTTASFSYKKTMSSSDINNNYHHIGSGNRYPMGASDLSPTTGIYDLGSNEYRWNKLFVGDIKKTGELTYVWNRVATSNLTATAASISFTNLNGDSNTAYFINYYAVLDSTSSWGVSMNMNGNAFSFGSQRLWGKGGNRTGQRLSSTSFFLMMERTDLPQEQNICQAIINIYAQTGKFRPIIGTGLRTAEITTSGVYMVEKTCSLLKDSGTTITSINFSPGAGDFFEPNTIIDLWARG